MHFSRHVRHTDTWQEIILIGRITHRPHETRSDSFRTGLLAELDFPFHAGLVANDKLGSRAFEILFDEGELTTGLMLFTTWTVKQISRRQVKRGPPHDC